ncbi:hypothetical protein ACFPVX_10460 [Cohnella faecalis]|uniref:Uncharacterized protein n=1 Tax=Cohnella faecalis TaxID=2315694 RepID=A0A398CM65_9BACL|nr:hypothetical protein [Cohnella faecalis]RIE03743.1 hypothetical protein D3H35_09300 [Cohnella faecalis]
MDFHIGSSRVIKQIVRSINSFQEDRIKSFQGGHLVKKNETFVDLMKVDYLNEISILEQIFVLEERFNIRFFTFNWPEGFRYESSFFAYIVFDNSKTKHRYEQNYFTIKIEQDALNKERHRVFFIPGTSNREVTIPEAFEILNKKSDVASAPLLNRELLQLGELTIGDLEALGRNIVDDESAIELSGSPGQQKSINAYLQLLKIKHDFILLKRIEESGHAFIEGKLAFEAYYIPRLKVAYREIEKNELTIRIINSDTKTIRIVHYHREYSLQQLFQFANLKTEVEDEFELLLTFSVYDLNVIALLAENVYESEKR